MKYIKMLGLMAVAAAAMMAFAATASAVSTTAPAGTSYTGAISSESEGKATLTGESGIKISCNSTVQGESVSTDANGTTSGAISKLTFTSCEGGTVHEGEDIANPGELIIHSLGNGNGTLTSTGSEVSTTVKSIFGTINCIYTTSGTDLGTLTGAGSSTGHATLHINAKIPRTGGSSLCGAEGTWSGAYKVTSPTGLTIH